MPPPGHPRRFPRALSRRAGFSLLEILIALALVALLTSLFIVSLPGLMNELGSRPLPEILQRSVRDARYQASLQKEMVSLRFDAERGAFVVLDGSGKILAERESGFGPDSPEVTVQFFQLLPQRGLRGPARETEQLAIDAVRFHPDRSSTPFLAQLDVGDVRSRHRYDPFSDLEIRDE